MERNIVSLITAVVIVASFMVLLPIEAFADGNIYHCRGGRGQFISCNGRSGSGIDWGKLIIFGALVGVCVLMQSSSKHEIEKKELAKQREARAIAYREAQGSYTKRVEVAPKVVDKSFKPKPSVPRDELEELEPTLVHISRSGHDRNKKIGNIWGSSYLPKLQKHSGGIHCSIKIEAKSSGKNTTHFIALASYRQAPSEGFLIDDMVIAEFLVCVYNAMDGGSDTVAYETSDTCGVDMNSNVVKAVFSKLSECTGQEDMLEVAFNTLDAMTDEEDDMFFTTMKG